MLIIHAENHFDRYSNTRLKPSDYVIQVLKYKDVKSGKFVKHYFQDINKLKKAIQSYHSKTQHKSNTLQTLLKSNSR